MVAWRIALATVSVGVVLGAACRVPGDELPPPGERLPGAAEFAADLQERVRRALAARGPEYKPRTRHLRTDGTPRYTNRLILQPSPYLLQHAHNPVDWYPWGDEAFAVARAQGKPVLLSVGYSTCHWCHVMEEESFEDEEIAAYLNGHYVAIKVDREERPDVDAAYMTAVQLLTGGGGWPMTVWLTPNREPFFGGTYFPARDGDRGARLGFLSLLRGLRTTYEANPGEAAARAGEITARVRRVATPAASVGLPDPAVFGRAFDDYAARFDETHGGFGRAPKFPMPGGLSFLLRYYRRTQSERALSMVTRTLAAMAAGGIYDHVGGGFHRYATDAAWRVPHFEKMLYDNAQLAVVYLEAYQVTKRDEFARVVRETLDYLLRDMRAPEGGFYAATDADSGGEEGRFFVWTHEEIAAVLDPTAAAAALAYYGVTERDNFEGGTILHVARPMAAVAEELGETEARVAHILDGARGRLRAARQRRVPPHTDTKVLAAWNGLAITAFARAGAVLDEARYVEAARTAAEFLLGAMRRDGSLRRSFVTGGAYQDAFLEDYAFVAAALLDLYETTFELRWLRAALELQAVLAARFWDPAGGGFFFTGADAGTPLVREKPAYDGALPSGNAVAAETLLRLGEFSGDDDYRARAIRTLEAFAETLERAPTSAARLLAAYEFLVDRPREIVIVRPREGRGEDAGPLRDAVRDTFVPNRILSVVTEGSELRAHQQLIPLLAEKQALGGRSTAYVCERGVCALPTTDPAALARQLRAAPGLPPAGAGHD